MPFHFPVAPAPPSLRKLTSAVAGAIAACMRAGPPHAQDSALSSSVDELDTVIVTSARTAEGWRIALP
jgi:hypothetical protein